MMLNPNNNNNHRINRNHLSNNRPSPTGNNNRFVLNGGNGGVNGNSNMGDAVMDVEDEEEEYKSPTHNK